MAKSSTAIFKSAVELINVHVELPFKVLNVSIARNDGRTTYTISGRHGTTAISYRVVCEGGLTVSSKGSFTVTVDDMPYKVEFLVVYNSARQGFLDIDGVGRLILTLCNDDSPVWHPYQFIRLQYRQPDAATTTAVWGAVHHVAQRLINRLSRVDLL